MKVLLIKDVYNLGRAGEVKKVADGFARNFLMPQKMAVIASTGAMKQIQKIEAAAARQRELLNEEMSGLAQQISGLELTFKAKVGETGKLYGSITQQTIIDEVNKQLNIDLDRHQIETQPLREAGDHKVRIRLTFDLVPELLVTVVNEDDASQKKAAEKKERSAKIEEVVEAEEEAVEAEEEAVVKEIAEEIAVEDEMADEVETEASDEMTDEEALEVEDSESE